MSSHVWDAKRFNNSTISLAADAFACAREGGLGYEKALRFVGYRVERCRQTDTGRSPLAIKVWLGVATRSGHRYARGRNAENYRVAGERLLAAMAERVGLEPGAPAQVVWDRLEDER